MYLGLRFYLGNVYIDPGDLHPRDGDPPLYGTYALAHPTYAHMHAIQERPMARPVLVNARPIASVVGVNTPDARAQSPRDVA
jgi:hypothetical protein